MNEILELASNYSASKHEELLPQTDNTILDKLNYIYDKSWESNNQYPYEILTYLFDAYYMLPKRPDLAALFGWQAINHYYYIELLNDSTIHKCLDSKGLDKIVDMINNNQTCYENMLRPFFNNIPMKSFNYVASYLLKGYAIMRILNSEKLCASSYKSLLKKFPFLETILENSYGEAYCQIVSPDFNGEKVVMNISKPNKTKSIQIRDGFAKKLRDLFLGNEVTFTSFDRTITNNYTFTFKEELQFALSGIIYASRCNNFHGNVAARMNSINANAETFTMYTDMFMLEYIILAILLHIKNIISDDVLDKVKENYNIMI